MSITEITIRTLGELVDRVTPAEPDPVTGRRRDVGVYRGAFDAGAPLMTSLDRLGGAPHSKADLEEHILRNFIRYSRPYLGREPVNDWEHLVSAQHHGVPTRLLDWTYSPLIAAFFATRPIDWQERARAVWRLDWLEVHKRFGLAARSMLIDDLGSMIDEGKGEWSPWHLFTRDRNGKPFACLLEPPSLDSRIVHQAAAFTLCSDKSQSFDAFLEQNGLAATLTRFVIPAGAVAKFRDQLDLVAVDERRLFPDLDGVAATLRRYYA